jgi:hypothetical protein
MMRGQVILLIIATFKFTGPEGATFTALCAKGQGKVTRPEGGSKVIY